MLYPALLSLITHIVLSEILIFISYQQYEPKNKQKKAIIISINFEEKKSDNSFSAKKNKDIIYKEKSDKKNYKPIVNTQESKAKDIELNGIAPSFSADSNGSIAIRTQPLLLKEQEILFPYPKKAKYYRIEGLVKLLLTISKEGRVVHAKVISGPDFGLREAALVIAKNLRFLPATNEKGEEILSHIEHEVVFKLIHGS